MAYGEWCNGSTTDSDSVCLGSNPSSPARLGNPTNRLIRTGFPPQTMDRPVHHGPHSWTIQPALHRFAAPSPLIVAVSTSNRSAGALGPAPSLASPSLCRRSCDCIERALTIGLAHRASVEPNSLFVLPTVRRQDRNDARDPGCGRESKCLFGCQAPFCAISKGKFSSLGVLPAAGAVPIDLARPFVTKVLKMEVSPTQKLLCTRRRWSSPLLTFLKASTPEAHSSSCPSPHSCSGRPRGSNS
jgi:hypothetical protein